MKWRYNGIDYDTKHDDSLYGFVYCVHYEDGNGNVYKYYGKKKWFAENHVEELKSGLRREKSLGEVRKRKPMTDEDLANRTKAQVRNGVRSKIVTYDIMHSDNDWREYVGSCKDTKDYIPFYKEIICFARTQRELTYLEAKIMFQRGALEDEDCLNGNLLGKFYRGNLV